jgi:hypothetical protein
LKTLGLEGEFKQSGVASFAHESYTSNGTLLGAYGASVRNGVPINSINETENNCNGDVGGEGEGEGEGGIDSGVESEVGYDEVAEETLAGLLANKDQSYEKDNNNRENMKDSKNIKSNISSTDHSIVPMHIFFKKGKSSRRIEKAQSRHNVHISRQELRYN